MTNEKRKLYMRNYYKNNKEANEKHKKLVSDNYYKKRQIIINERHEKNKAIAIDILECLGIKY